MRLLLLQEPHAAAINVRLAVSRLDCAVDEVATAGDVHDALAVNSYDLLIADLDVVGENTGEFLRMTQASQAVQRHLVLSRRSDLDRIIEALEIGADEFLLKPVDPDELRLRIGALVSGRVERATPVLECGPLRLQMMTQEVWLDGQPLELSPRERSVLQVLLRGRGSVVSKDHIASRIFAMDEEVTLTAIETYVSRLRRKTAHPALEIRTVHGLGYVLESRG